MKKERGSTAGFLVCTIATLIGLLALKSVTSPDPSRKNVEIFTEMSYSQAYEPLSPNPNFADGSTQQHLVEGVVRRGHLPFPYGPGEEEAQRAGRELENPYSRDDAEVPRLGAELYRIYCVSCHGAGGDGDGPVVSRGLAPPASLKASRAKEMRDGRMFHVLTRGQGRMASYAAQLDPDERWKVILHIRSLQEENR